MIYHIEVTDGQGEALQVWDCEDFVEVNGTLKVQFDENDGILYRLPEGSIVRATMNPHGGFDQ